MQIGARYMRLKTGIYCLRNNQLISSFYKPTIFSNLLKSKIKLLPSLFLRSLLLQSLHFEITKYSIRKKDRWNIISYKIELKARMLVENILDLSYRTIIRTSCSPERSH